METLSRRKSGLFRGIMAVGTIMVCLIALCAYYGYLAFADPFVRVPIRVVGAFPVAEDAELGFGALIDGESRWVDARSGLDYHMFTDRRGARVDRPGQQTPERVDILTIGGSFAYGPGVENEGTFSSILGRETGKTVANVAFSSYGTVQSLQLWRRNRDLRPKYVIYPIIDDHLRRNLSPCAPSLSPYCLPVAHVVFDPATGSPSIAPPPWEHRISAEMRAAFLRDVVFTDRVGLADVLWKARMDLYRIEDLRAYRYDDSPELRRRAAAYLFGLLAREVVDAGARLLVVYIPQINRAGTLLPPSEELQAAIVGQPLSFLDLTPVMAREQAVPGQPPLFIPADRHPSAAGHCVIAEAIRQTWFAADVSSAGAAKEATACGATP